MRRKHYSIRKFKQKQHMNTFVKEAYSEFYLKNRKLSKNFITFFKKFHYLGVAGALRISRLLGVPPSLKFNTLNSFHVKRIFRMLALKFYIDYSFIKEKKNLRY